MWKLYRLVGFPKDCVVFKEGFYVQFKLGAHGMQGPDIMLNVSNIMILTNPARELLLHSGRWEDMGIESEYLKEMYDVVHMVQLMED